MFLLALSAIQLPSAEFRGLWVDAYHAGFRSAKEVDQLISDARAGNFNALIVQVRRRGDSLYHSHLEPKAFDVRPQEFDPLADLIAKAHDTNAGPRLEIHAWIVTYPIWDRRTTPPTQPDHPYLLHPDWLTQNVEGETWNTASYVFDPGHPTVQQHTFDVAMDIIANYDVDGLNLDYIRYDGLAWGYNKVAVKRFNEQFGRTGKPTPADPVWMQWRRDQVTALVRKIYLSAAALKPNVKISADTITFAPGVTSVTGWTNASAAFTSVLQDWRGWMEEGILDINIPMTYFDHDGNHRQSWTNWNTFIKNSRYGRHAVLGPGAFLNGVSNTVQQIRDTREKTVTGNTADGVSLYSYFATTDEKVSRADFLSALTKAGNTGNPPVFARAVVTPEMTWKTSPTRGHLKGTLAIENVTLRPALDLIRLTGPGLNKWITPDATGFFGAANLEPGDYRLIAARDGFYPVIADVSVAAGSIASLDFTLNQLPAETAPIVALQPEDGAGLFGETISFQSVAAASIPAFYQWNFEGQPIEGATNSTLNLASVDFAMAGRYALVLSNNFGMVTSDVARLEVAAPEGIYAVRSSAGYDSAILSWRTSEPGDTRITFGIDSDLVETISLPWANTTNHSVRLAGLDPSSTYALEISTRSGETLFAEKGLSFRTAGEIVIDNDGAAFSGGWSTGTSASGRLGPSYRFAGTTTGAATSRAHYVPDIPAAGVYDVAVWHPHGSNRSTNTPFVVTYEGGALTNVVDQTRDGGCWLQLASGVPMSRGVMDGVSLSNATGEKTRVVIADAVRFNYRQSQDSLDEPSVPTWWARHFFNRAVDGVADPDGDLYTNREEFLLGSDPTVAASSVHTVSVIAKDGLLHILFSPAQSDRVYHLEYSTDLNPAIWTRAEDMYQFVLPTFDGGFIAVRPFDQQIIYRITADFPVFGPMPAPTAILVERM